MLKNKESIVNAELQIHLPELFEREANHNSYFIDITSKNDCGVKYFKMVFQNVSDSQTMTFIVTRDQWCKASTFITDFMDLSSDI